MLIGIVEYLLPQNIIVQIYIYIITLTATSRADSIHRQTPMLTRVGTLELNNLSLRKLDNKSICRACMTPPPPYQPPGPFLTN